MAIQEDHSFDRRAGDVNVQALTTRMTALEGRVDSLEQSTRDNTSELRANTVLTQQVHEAMFGKDSIEGAGKGVQQLVGEMYEIVETGKSFFRWIDKAASGAGRTSDWISRTLKRFWWVIAIAMAVGTYLKTGKWELPVWPG